MVALVPFPTQIDDENDDENESGEPRRKAISEVRGALEYELPTLKLQDDALDEVDLEIVRIAGAASARIERYAPSAPDAVKDEALIRFVSWLSESSGVINPQNITGLNVTSPPENQSRAFRLSGAMGLLSQWRIRGVGLVEESTS